MLVQIWTCVQPQGGREHGKAPYGAGLGRNGCSVCCGVLYGVSTGILPEGGGNLTPSPAWAVLIERDSCLQAVLHLFDEILPIEVVGVDRDADALAESFSVQAEEFDEKFILLFCRHRSWPPAVHQVSLPFLETDLLSPRILQDCQLRFHRSWQGIRVECSSKFGPAFNR